MYVLNGYFGKLSKCVNYVHNRAAPILVSASVSALRPILALFDGIEYIIQVY